ncbi:histone-fold-containing protein [Dendrothele bispora CBS 962.96]|uniref:DNA polymerase epsilon subunit D n=1 Tax=Dendrothele bispora (strain CBS 962.96) TaxID=1314807 RepID=A0A4S8LHK0_DENBC|nr:histone-fold-containing protein [Dendrothele bispora CBS 962.96]
MPRKDQSGPISAQQQQDLVSEGIGNFELPKSIVTRIAKSAIPENTKLQKETILSLVKGSTVFINYLAATAHDVAQSKQHKSISASDVLKALEMLELGDLVDPLQAELQIFREQNKNDKGRRTSTSVSSAPKGKATAPPDAAGVIKLSSVSKGKGKVSGSAAKMQVDGEVAEMEAEETEDVDQEMHDEPEESEHVAPSNTSAERGQISSEARLSTQDHPMEHD